jgi:hypothetical protein
MSQSLKIFPYKNNGLINVKNNRLANLVAPINTNDVVTKAYVDSALVGANDPEALKAYALIANNQTVTHSSERSAEYTCVKVNSTTTSSFGLTFLGDGTNAVDSGVAGDIRTMYARNGKVYFGGTFTNKFAVYDIMNQTWSTLGSSFGGTVTRILVDSNNNVYVLGGGNFNKYTAATSTWSIISYPTFITPIGTSYSFTMDSNDLIYVPMISSFGGIKTLYTYNGSTWTNIANLSGSGASVYSYTPDVISVDTDGTIYIAGSFGLRKRDGSSWVTVGDQFTTSDGSITNIMFNANHDVYIGSNTLNTDIQYYNGSTWSTINFPDTISNIGVNSMAYNADGNIFITKESNVYLLDVSTNEISTYYNDANESYDYCVFIDEFLYIGGNFIDGADVRHAARLGTTSNTTYKIVIVQPPSTYSFVDLNNNSTTYSNVTFTTVGEKWTIYYSTADDTYYAQAPPV